jgi:hypothetical protein
VLVAHPSRPAQRARAPQDEVIIWCRWHKPAASSWSGASRISLRSIRATLALKMSPAMTAGVTKRLWEMSDVVDMLEAWESSNRT